MLHTLATVLLYSLLVLSLAATVMHFIAREIEGVIKALALACAAVVALIWLG
jgi:hypothetical protein